MLIATLMLTSCSINLNFKTKEKTEPTKSSISVENTAYIASDGSFLILGKIGDEKGFNWFKTSADLSDNFFSGKYTAYIGEEGMNFVTEEKPCYGVTKEEINRSTPDKDRFVVLYVEYDDFFVDGMSQIGDWNNSIDTENPKSCMYYGVVEQNGDLSLVNMLTATPYSFKKTELTTDETKTPEVLPEEPDISDEEEPAAENNSREELKKVKYNIPEGYSLLNNGTDYTLYAKEDDTLTIFFMDGETLKHTKAQSPEGKDFKVNGHDAYMYKYEDKFCTSILGNGGEYIIQATSQKALDEVVRTFKFQ